MQSNDALFFRFIALGAAITVVGVLTWMFGWLILCIGGVFLLLGAFRFLIAPALPLLAEAARLRAESDKIIVESELVESQQKRIEAETAQINAQTAAMQAQAALEMQKVLHMLQNLPNAYEIKPDPQTGLYPQFIGKDGRLLGYVPTQLVRGKPAAQLVGPAEEETSEEDAQPQRVYLLSDQIEQGLTRADELESVIGYNERGEMIRGELFSEEGNFFDSMQLYGDQNAGKTLAAVYFAALTILHRGCVIVIDPDSETRQGLLNRLGPLAAKPFMLCNPGIDPQSALRALQVAELELEKPGKYPLLLLVDESTLLFREAENGGMWQEVGLLLRNVAENYSTRGRKRYRRVILLGQITKAGRSGNTEVRGNLAKLVFKLKLEKAQIIFKKSFGYLAEIATRLTPGRAIVLPDRADEDTYTLQLPKADERGLEMVRDIALRLLQRSVDEEEDADDDTPDNLTAITPELERKMLIARVRQLRAQGITSISDMSRILFAVTRGASEQWPECRDKIKSAIAQIEREEQYRLVNGGQL